MDMQKKLSTAVLLVAMVVFLFMAQLAELEDAYGKETDFSFIVTADMREYGGSKYQDSKYFQGVCEAIELVGKGAFMISPGDIDPPWEVSETIARVLGDDYYWYPAVGNHEAETDGDMEWIREWYGGKTPGLVRRGPEGSEETTFSFEHGNAHFVLLNIFYDGDSDTGTDGDVVDELYDWLKSDLEANSKPVTFVFGHDPMVSIPDADNGRQRPVDDSMNAYPENNIRFQKLLREHGVAAYFCGHTHNYSDAKINGVWQIDAGHARGMGDTGARSTFLKVNVGDEGVSVEVYRDDAKGGEYALRRVVALD